MRLFLKRGCKMGVTNMSQVSNSHIDLNNDQLLNHNRVFYVRL